MKDTIKHYSITRWVNYTKPSRRKAATQFADCMTDALVLIGASPFQVDPELDGDAPENGEVTLELNMWFSYGNDTMQKAHIADYMISSMPHEIDENTYWMEY